jgi:hypothetical protein
VAHHHQRQVSKAAAPQEQQRWQTNLGGVGDLLLADLRDELLLALQQLASERNAQVRQVGLARR